MKNLIKKLEKLLKNDDIIDIIVFGSFSKNRINYNDIDLAVLSKLNNRDYKKEINKIIPHCDVQIITLKDIHKSIFITLLKEGYSLKKKDYLHNQYGFKPVKLYKYSLKQLTASKKVMFERGIKTISNLTKLSNSVVLVPIEKTGEFEDFLKSWDLDIDTEEYELIPMMRKEIFD